VALELDLFVSMLTRWNVAQNLVSREASDLWERHIADSAQLIRYLGAHDRRLLDIGSGGGLPAIPLAILARSRNLAHVLIESNGKKVSFLRATVRALSLNAKVWARRGEAVDSRETFDFISARAVAPLRGLLGLIHPYTGGETRALLHKGRDFQSEIDDAAAQYRFDVVIHTSDTDPDGVILEISNLQIR